MFSFYCNFSRDQLNCSGEYSASLPIHFPLTAVSALSIFFRDPARGPPRWRVQKIRYHRSIVIQNVYFFSVNDIKRFFSLMLKGYFTEDRDGQSCWGGKKRADNKPGSPPEMGMEAMKFDFFYFTTFMVHLILLYLVCHVFIGYTMHKFWIGMSRETRLPSFPLEKLSYFCYKCFSPVHNRILSHYETSNMLLIGGEKCWDGTPTIAESLYEKLSLSISIDRVS